MFFINRLAQITYLNIPLIVYVHQNNTSKLVKGIMKKKIEK